MKICPYCSAEILDEAEFCLHCMRQLAPKAEFRSKIKKPYLLTAVIGCLLALLFCIIIILIIKFSANEKISVFSTADASGLIYASKNEISVDKFWDNANVFTDIIDSSLKNKVDNSDSDAKPTDQEAVNTKTDTTKIGNSNDSDEEKGKDTDKVKGNSHDYPIDDETGDSYSDVGGSSGSSGSGSSGSSSSGSSSSGGGSSDKQSGGSSSEQSSNVSSQPSSAPSSTPSDDDKQNQVLPTWSVKDVNGGVEITGIANYNTTGEYVIPSKIDKKTVVGIGFQAFYYEQNLKSIILPNTLKYIDEQAFAYCNSLTQITIPKSVTEIRNNAFLPCNKLADIYIASTDLTIANYAFSNSNQRNVTLTIHAPSTVMDSIRARIYWSAEYTEWNG